MERRNVRPHFAAGLIVLGLASGCNSFHHRGKVPPPRNLRESDPQVGFSSDPRPTQSALNGQVQPAGPVSNGSVNPYGSASRDNEVTSAPLGEPAPVLSSGSSGGTPPPSPNPFQ
jgi:hypothetical protein